METQNRSQIQYKYLTSALGALCSQFDLIVVNLRVQRSPVREKGLSLSARLHVLVHDERIHAHIEAITDSSLWAGWRFPLRLS